MAVLAVFLVEGKYNHDYGHITGSILEARSTMGPVAVPDTFDLSRLLPRGSDYIFYEGSLTTPPYTECVLWTVMLRPVEVSVNQVTLCTSLLFYSYSKTTVTELLSSPCM
ncbi:hypothetical protein OESDEN_23964 [Oesophagostomum dentatum]|uniref:Alpha-carbonic anhydrase domain-containing protein n=1 Tax=Oesophagostomum dentatum TaxID=61180 RepID=A0A0B1RXQ5_OESDE|nr:hypothetical protein OESDEN_23964 [Oesophagostomum dentatum]